jgi:acyl-CoA thioester hydrolase
MHISEVKIRVRYGETDAMGIVYHGAYLPFLEEGREAFIEEAGMKYIEIEEAGYVSPVLDVQISYKHPAKYGDILTVKVWLEENSLARTTYGYEIYNENDDLCITAFTKHSVVRKDNFKPVSIKKVFPKLYAEYERRKKQ